MTAFLAMMLDAYRELNAKKLFWITLGLSGLVVLIFGSIGFNEKGMSVGYGLMHVESEFINSTTPWARAFYVGLFSDFIVALWLSWVAIILALVSTCTIFPDFIAGGTIDLVLSKPLRRITIFGMKYVMSLMFVVLQVLMFAAGIFLCIGLRIGEWNWMIFAAVPVVTIFYSYLFAVCVLGAMITRSAITSLLLTLLLWFLLFGLNLSSGLLLNFQLTMEIEAEHAQMRIEQTETRLASLDPDPNEPGTAVARHNLQERLEEDRAALKSNTDAATKLRRWHRPTRVIMFIMPKTDLTVDLLSRWLDDPDGFNMSGILSGDMSGSDTSSLFGTPAEVEAGRRLEAFYDAYSVWYIVGTSLAFEAVVLAIACLIFVRRDF